MESDEIGCHYNLKRPICRMKPLVFGRWSLCCDREATQRAYRSIAIGGPEACGCLHCQNFTAARDQIYPSDVLRIFDELGIDQRRECEVYHLTRMDSGVHLYGGWFHCVGRIEGESPEIGKYDLEGADGSFKFYFSDSSNLLPDSFQGLPILQLEFTAQVPWVLPEPEPE